MKTINNENTEKEDDEKEEIENEPKPTHNFLREEQLTNPQATEDVQKTREFKFEDQ